MLPLTALKKRVGLESQSNGFFCAGAVLLVVGLLLMFTGIVGVLYLFDVFVETESECKIETPHHR